MEKKNRREILQVTDRRKGDKKYHGARCKEEEIFEEKKNGKHRKATETPEG